MFENDYTINGKHATYLKFLAKKNARDDQSPDNPTAARLFERYIDVYMNAAVFGLLYNRTAKRDNSSDDRARVYADAFANDAHTQVVPANDIPEGWEGLDAGPATQKAFAEAIKGAKTILWNGPAGVFEFDNFTAGSRAIAEAIAEATKNGAFSLIGGGDSVACINKFGMADQVSYISTGGGALLEAIEGKILPGIAAIKG